MSAWHCTRWLAGCCLEPVKSFTCLALLHYTQTIGFTKSKRKKVQRTDVYVWWFRLCRVRVVVSYRIEWQYQEQVRLVISSFRPSSSFFRSFPQASWSDHPGEVSNAGRLYVIYTVEKEKKTGAKTMCCRALSMHVGCGCHNSQLPFDLFNRQMK